jgi:hypothetical protein
LDTCVYLPTGEFLYLVDTNAGGIPPHFTPRIFHIGFCPYNPGDLSWDENVDIVDVISLINYLFRNGQQPCPLKAADVNCDQQVGLVDVVYLINYIFRSGPPPQTCDY